MPARLSRELRIAHPVAVAGQVVDTLAGLLARLTVGIEGGQDGIDLPCVQLVPAVLAPLGGQVRAGAVEGPGDIAQMLLGVAEVDDFDGAGEHPCAPTALTGYVDTPGRTSDYSGRAKTKRLLPLLGRSSGVMALQREAFPPVPVPATTYCRPSTA